MYVKREFRKIIGFLTIAMSKRLRFTDTRFCLEPPTELQFSFAYRFVLNFVRSLVHCDALQLEIV